MQAFNPSLLNLLTVFCSGLNSCAITGIAVFLSTIPIPFAWSRSGYEPGNPKDSDF